MKPEQLRDSFLASGVDLEKAKTERNVRDRVDRLYAVLSSLRASRTPIAIPLYGEVPRRYGEGYPAHRKLQRMLDRLPREERGNPLIYPHERIHPSPDEARIAYLAVAEKLEIYPRTFAFPFHTDQHLYRDPNPSGDNISQVTYTMFPVLADGMPPHTYWHEIRVANTWGLSIDATLLTTGKRYLAAWMPSPHTMLRGGIQRLVDSMVSALMPPNDGSFPDDASF